MYNSEEGSFPRDFLDNSLSSNEFEDSSFPECMLCEKRVGEKEFPKIITKALHRKYCTNLNNFFYLKDIKGILEGHRYGLTLSKQRTGVYSFKRVDHWRF